MLSVLHVLHVSCNCLPQLSVSAPYQPMNGNNLTAVDIVTVHTLLLEQAYDGNNANHYNLVVMPDVLVDIPCHMSIYELSVFQFVSDRTLISRVFGQVSGFSLAVEL